MFDFKTPLRKSALLLQACALPVTGHLAFADAPAPLLLLPFDEGKGTFADDKSPAQHEVELTNLDWVRGKFGTALRFRGENSFVDLPPIPGLNGASEFTLSLWVQWEESGGRYPNLVSSTNWSPGGMLIFVTDDSCSFRMGTNDTPGNAWKETGVPLLDKLPKKQWTHLCVTFSKPDIKTYVNGRKVAEAKWDHPLKVDKLRLGGWQNAVTHRGLLDEIRIDPRALAPEEVEKLAADPSRSEPGFEIIDDTPGATQPAATYDNGQAVLSIDDYGRATSLREQMSGVELLAHPASLVTVTTKNGQVFSARKITKQGDDLVFHFSKGGKAVIGVESHAGFFTFTVRSLDFPEAAKMTFCQLSPTRNQYVGQMANMLSDDEFAVCLRGYELPVEMSASVKGLSVGTTEKYGLTGWRAGLAAGAKNDMPGILRAMAKHAGVPTSDVTGPYSLGSEANRGSYLFADLSLASVDDWIDLAKRGGFTTVHLHGWWSSLGHYDPNPGYFPKGLPDLIEAAKRIKAAGLRVGIHTLTGCISPNDPWITPVPSPHLIPFTSYTLERDMSADDTVIHVKELPVDYHDTVFTYSGNGNAIRIGGEIIQYTRISREKPYAFLDCKRGAFGTKPSAHPEGAQADYLQQSYISFYPQPDSPLADELADRIANVFNTGEMDNIYFDGSEGMVSRYGIDAMRHKIFKRLKGNPLAEASCHGAHNWWVHSRMGAWDHPVWGAKPFHDEHIASASRHRKADLLEPQLGWWAPRESTAMARGHFPDEIEYFGVKNLGLDGAMSIQGVNVTSAVLPDGIEKQITLLGWYERLRLARYFDRQTLDRIAEPGSEFRLRQDESGQWKFTPLAMETRRIGTQENSERWATRNPFGPQPLSFRLEALHATAANPSGSPQGLAGEDDFPNFKGTSSSPSVKLAIEETQEDTKDGARNLRLKARNDSPAVKGAWTRATLQIPDPYRNLKGNAAFGVWIKGDGKGALLNIQLGTPREHLSAMSDHLVKIDFTGWRFIEVLLRERDTSRLHDDVWPFGGHGGSHALYRNPVQMEYLSQVSVYLNQLPVGQDVEITLSPIRALPTQSVELKQPVLEANGKKITVPFTLASGHYAELEPDGSLIHYDERGLIQERVQIDPSLLPTMASGENTLAYSCSSSGNGKARAEISTQYFGAPFGDVNPDNAKAAHMRDEYALPRRIISAAGDQETWKIQVRPGEKATLGIEIVGEVENPVIEAGGHPFAFPAKLEKDHRLVCPDGRQWKIIGKDRAIIAQGSLEAEPPVLSSGSHPVRLTSGARNRPLVKLTKHYR